MKVIKKGEGWKKQLTCKGCKAVLEFSTDDIQYEVSEEEIREQHEKVDIQGSYYITCPECEQNTKLKAKELPNNIVEFLRSKE